MSKLKLICLAGGITVGLGLLLYRHGKRLICNSRCNQNNIGKEVVTFKQPPTTQKPPPPPQPECSSLVIRDLMNQWEVNPSFKEANCVQQGSTVIQVQPKAGDIIKIDEFTMLRLAFAKTPLMVFNDLYKHVTIRLQHHPTGATNNITRYTATFKIGGKTYTINDICKKQAKQIERAIIFRNKFENELVKNYGFYEMEIGDNFKDQSKPKGPFLKDFLFSECSSLGIRDLMNQWEVNPSSKVATCIQQGSTVIQIQPKAGDIIKIDEFTMLRLAFAKTPLMVFNDLYKHVTIRLQHHPTGATNNITRYTATFKIGGKTYTINDICKKQAKQIERAIIFRNKFENELVKNYGFYEMEIGDNFKDQSKPKGPFLKDFLFSECSSLGIRDLMNQWEVNPSSKVATCIQQGSTVIQIQPKAGDIIKIDEFTMLRLAFAKTPLMVFNDLYKHVTIRLQHHPTGATNNITRYTATFKIGGKTYTINDICKKQAKQIERAIIFRNKFENELVKNYGFYEMEIGDNFKDQSKPKGPFLKDFLFSECSSLGIRDLMNQWEVNPSFKEANCVQQGSTVIQVQPKAGDIIKIDEFTMLRLAFAKTPLMVFNDLYKHVAIRLQHHSTGATNHITSYTATFKIGGKTYTANDICKKRAKQKACASFFRDKFENELKKNKEFHEMKIGDNFKDQLIPKGSFQEDFLFSECSSLGIRDLMNQWEVNPSFKVATCVQQGSTVIQIQPKAGDIIKIDEITMLRLAFAKTPLMVFNDLYKHVTIKLQHHPAGATNHITSYTASFEIGGKTYTANDICKKQAKQKACACFFRDKFENELKKNTEFSEIEIEENY